MTPNPLDETPLSVLKEIRDLLKQHNKRKAPIAGNVLASEDFKKNLVGRAEDGVACFVNQVR